MSVNSVTNSTSYTTSTTTSSRDTSSELGKEDFLNLLVTQLKNQDPLDPSDSTEYVSQLAQFSVLEQMSNLNSRIAVLESMAMTGKYATASITDSTGSVTSVEGTVDSVTLDDGEASLVIDGTSVDLDDVTSVYDYDRSDLFSMASMIGKTCEGYVYDADTLDVMSVEGTVSGVYKGTYEDYAIVDGVTATLDSITSDDYSSSEDELEYLNDHIGEEISVNITDSEKTVPVTAVLESADEGDDGSISLTLNNVKVPIDGIYSVN
ncbi:flagellar hook capping protein [Desulfosporosinus orientis DSM 765]|uniref:Basal-body rod modification protein FlgD n=1 Tax=Desulfosporosinus orientis (strain ATCC 19365 / DSM 765 / NCIMB 8382 / VKM B-1628 / Singapore I) TaxID=768706 RepID=G7WIV5_DESOD|nr:flagellar hook capping FlgD N-terminal domain-containing protein [Desulfosporosinus orientis]AET69680.1 flagellar hook capping protein [Desulfosporosinus orientis DSM 765]